MISRALANAVGDVMRRTGSELMGRYRPGSPNPLMDSTVEAALSVALCALLHGSEATGEEAAHGDKAEIARALRRPGAVWIIDPVDGSRNFATGEGPFVMMAALSLEGHSSLSAIYDPIRNTLATAIAAGGAWLDGEPVVSDDGPVPAEQLAGLVPLQYLPEPVNARVRQGLPALGSHRAGHRCVGREYLDLVEGRQDFAVFWQTKPWDHLPGLLLVRESGMAAARLDLSPVDLVDGSKGMIVARSAEVVRQVHAALFA